MVWEIEVVAEVSVSLTENAGSVVRNSIVQSVHCHANVLFSAYYACYEVYNLVSRPVRKVRFR